MGRVWEEGRRLRGKPTGVGAAENEDGVGRRGRLASRNSRSKEASARRTASSAVARTVERGSSAVAGSEFNGRRLLSSSNPVPMRCSPRLDCSSFFADGVLIYCSSLRVLDEQCRLRLVSSRCVLHRQSHLSAIAIEQVQRSARLLHLQLCVAVHGFLYSFFPTCLFFLATHMLLFL
ncbi:hypothetical protein VPH35_020482 [Triticum aestivum]